MFRSRDQAREENLRCEGVFDLGSIILNSYNATMSLLY